MSKAVNMHSNPETSIRIQAEQVLSGLGIPLESAIDLFLSKVVQQKGIPFEIGSVRKEPLNLSKLTKEEFDVEMEKGNASARAGRVKPAARVRERMQRKYKEYGI